MSMKQGIHIVAMEIRNMYRIRFARVKVIPGVGFVRVTGDNEEGKTSLLHAVMAGFGGAGEVLPAALNDEAGGEPGYVKLELSNDFTIRRDITEANPKGILRVMGPDGGKHSQSKLNGWLGDHHEFDILAFFGLKPARQTQILLGLGTDPDLASKLATKKADHSRLFDERTPFIAEQRRARAVKKPEGERPDQVDVSGEMDRLGELQATQRRRGDLGREVNDYREKLAKNRARREEIAETHDLRVVKAREEIEKLKGAIALLDETAGRDVDMYVEESASLTAAHAELMSAGKETKATFEAMADVTDEIDAATDRISKADVVNQRLEPWKRWEAAEQELEAATVEHDLLTAQMQDIKAEEAKLIAEAEIPVEGLSFGENAEPLLKGRPLAVASGAQKIRMAAAVAFAADPELRVCLIDEANDVGMAALEALDEEAKQRDFQILGCRLGLEGPGEIIVDDGFAWSDGDEEAVEDERSEEGQERSPDFDQEVEADATNSFEDPDEIGEDEDLDDAEREQEDLDF